MIQSKLNPEQCHEWVMGDGMLSWQCSRKPVVERHGLKYCRIHDPEYVKEKAAKREAKYRKEAELRQVQYRKDKARHGATAGLTTEELEALTPDLARAAPEMYEALKVAHMWFSETVGYTPLHSATLGAITKAIAKAEGRTP